MRLATVQAYNSHGDIYLNDAERFDNHTLAMMFVEKYTWSKTTGVNFIMDGYFETLFRKGYVEYIDAEGNRFVAMITEENTENE